MAKSADSKTLMQLTEKFTEAAEQAKQLDTVITSFSGIVHDFQETLIIVEDEMQVNNLADLSKSTVERLQEIKALNELQLLELLNDAIKKQNGSLAKTLQTTITNANKSKMTKMEKQLNELTVTVQCLAESVKEEPTDSGAGDHQKILTLLQKIEHQTQNGKNGQLVMPMEKSESSYLRKMVKSLNTKIKKLDEEFEERVSLVEMEYEERIGQLENEILALKYVKESDENQVENQEVIVEITDDDLPF